MKKTTTLVILALMGAVSQTQGQVNPKISQLFEELEATKTTLFNRPPSIVKRGGRDNDAIQRKQDIAASRVARNDALSRLLRELPNEFVTNDLKKLLDNKGMNKAGSSIYIKRMIEREMVMELGDHYKKIDIDDP